MNNIIITILLILFLILFIIGLYFLKIKNQNQINITTLPNITSINTLSNNNITTLSITSNTETSLLNSCSSKNITITSNLNNPYSLNSYSSQSTNLTINLDNIINYKNIPAYNQNPLDNLIIKSNKCCLINKEYIPDRKDIWGGTFKYKFTPLQNTDCNPLLYDINSNTQLFFDGENNWNNIYCNNLTKISSLGSCRNNVYECIDFVSKDYCDNMNTKYNTNMTWSSNTCEIPLQYKLNDKIKFNTIINNMTSFSLF
jgi:PIN domain nuclease of toxin-antitoxin system